MVAAMVNVPHGLPSQRVDDDQRHHRQQNNHDQQHRHQRHKPADLADLLARHLAQRFAITPHRAEQNDEILYGSAQHRAEENPQRSRQIAELRSQGRAHQRTRSRDRGEVMAEQNPLVGGLVIVAVAQAFRGRCPPVVQQSSLSRQ